MDNSNNVRNVNVIYDREEHFDNSNSNPAKVIHSSGTKTLDLDSEIASKFNEFYFENIYLERFENLLFLLVELFLFFF